MNEIHRWCEKCFWWSNKSLFLAWQEAVNCNGKDSLYADVNDNENRFNLPFTMTINWETSKETPDCGREVRLVMRYALGKLFLRVLFQS